MDGSTTQPKIFISYSWSTPQHEQWVVSLAERLSVDGVVVMLDKWDLHEGQDKHVFMEKMVNDKTLDKVLIICDSTYQKKADDRDGGVGTETYLISKEVYENAAQEKFIPVIREYDSEGNPCTPAYISTRIYINLSTDEIFEDEYQKLLRNIFNKPLHKRPPLGTPPAYILEDEQPFLATAHKVDTIKDALLKDRKSANGLIDDYLETFLLTLQDFRLNGANDNEFDEKVLQSIERMLPLRDDFVNLTSIIFKYQDNVDIEKFKTFFEQSISLLQHPTSIQSYTDADEDNYKFFLYELMLYFVANALHHSKYENLAHIVQAEYFYKRPNYEELKNANVGIFNTYARSLDEGRKNRLKLNRVSITADKIKERATRQDITFENIQEADLVLYYVTQLQGKNHVWFPRTSAFGMDARKVELFQRMISKYHFDKVKVLFDVQSVDEFKKLVTNFIQQQHEQEARYLSDWYFHILPMKTVFDLEKICAAK